MFKTAVRHSVRFFFVPDVFPALPFATPTLRPCISESTDLIQGHISGSASTCFHARRDEALHDRARYFLHAPPGENVPKLL